MILSLVLNEYKHLTNENTYFIKITGESSSAATAIVSVQAATGSIHAHLLMSGLLASSNSGIIDIDNIVSNVSFPLEVKFESRDEVTGETRIIVEDLSLPNIDNVSSVTNNVSPNTLNTCKDFLHDSNCEFCFILF